MRSSSPLLATSRLFIQSISWNSFRMRAKSRLGSVRFPGGSKFPYLTVKFVLELFIQIVTNIYSGCNLKNFVIILNLKKKNYANVCIKLGYKVCRTCVPDSIRATVFKKSKTLFRTNPNGLLPGENNNICIYFGKILKASL
jgi:hypothetical protein